MTISRCLSGICASKRRPTGELFATRPAEGQEEDVEVLDSAEG